MGASEERKGGPEYLPSGGEWMGRVHHVEKAVIEPRLRRKEEGGAHPSPIAYRYLLRHQRPLLPVYRDVHMVRGREMEEDIDEGRHIARHAVKMPVSHRPEVYHWLEAEACAIEEVEAFLVIGTDA